MNDKTYIVRAVFTMSLLKHCGDGNLSEIRAILRHTKGRRNKVQVRDNHNWTCLHHAVKSGSVECIKFLLTINEVDTTAETFEGETALHIACNVPNVSLEIITLLVEANPDLVLFVNNEEVDLLQCSIKQKRLDIVKLLIANGAPVNNQDLDGDTALHIAAIESQLDVIRYLIYETHCDPTICNGRGMTACFLQFLDFLLNVMPVSDLSADQIECFEELTQFTYNERDTNNTKEVESELNQMIFFGYQYEQPRSCLYFIIVKLFYVPPSKQYFFKKILQTNVPSCHCLIVALLADKILLLEDAYSDSFNQMYTIWSKFLVELFALFLSDEPFFEEYVPEIMSNGWKYCENSQARNFCTFITQSKDSLELQKLFSFLRTLILYEIDFDSLIRRCLMFLEPKLILSVFAPLAKFVTPCDSLGRNLIGCNLVNCKFNFNESYNVLYDWKFHPVDPICEAVSLKNLCRMSIRRHYFQTYSHYTAVKAMYSLNIPCQIRNFLCYNFCNFKF